METDWDSANHLEDFSDDEMSVEFSWVLGDFDLDKICTKQTTAPFAGSVWSIDSSTDEYEVVFRRETEPGTCFYYNKEEIVAKLPTPLPFAQVLKQKELLLKVLWILIWKCMIEKLHL